MAVGGWTSVVRATCVVRAIISARICGGLKGLASDNCWSSDFKKTLQPKRIGLN